MSGPEIPSPAREPEESPCGGRQANPPDPLLDSGSFIDPDRSDYGVQTPDNPKSEEAAENPNSDEPQKVEFGPGVVIAAEPISVFIPTDESMEAAKRSRRRMDTTEMSKRPSWLPADWKIHLKTRTQGASAGLIDRYYIDPTGKYKFRSRIEVAHFVDTGEKLRRTGGTPGKSPAEKKQKKSSSKSKKSEAKSNSTPNSKRRKTGDANSDKATPGQ